MSIQGSSAKRPTTAGDDGKPSSSCSEDAKRLFRLIEDERHLCAHDLFIDLEERLAKPLETSPAPKKLRLRKSHQAKKRITEQENDLREARELLKSKEAVLDKLEKRCRLFRKAKQSLDVDDDWTLAQTMFGVTTFYRREEDGSLSIKMEGTLKDVPLFDQVAVLREVDLHHKWAPFCSSSLTVAHIEKLDTVGWFVVGLPNFGLMRDACFRAIGCDSIFEDGSILLVAQGIADKPSDGVARISFEAIKKDSATNKTDSTSLEPQVEDDFEFLSNDPILKQLDIPPLPTRMGSGRMTIRKFFATIHVESPTTARTRLIANIDPNLPLIPQSLLDFLMKKLCGVLLSKLQNAAKRVSKDPINNAHACKMRQEEAFYKVWLMEKFKGICEVRGWDMPPVSSFELTDQQLELAQIADEKRSRNKGEKVVRLYHSLSSDKLDDFFESSNNSGRSEPASVGAGQGPRRRAMTSESDCISELSSSSSIVTQVWQKNPISLYMRELEERTQLRKAREVEKARERAANRLKPKELDEASRERLDELRAARKRRLEGCTTGKDPVVIDTPSPQGKIQRRGNWGTMWKNHGLVTRIFAIILLVGLLFGLLYTDSIFTKYMDNGIGSWWMGRSRDAITVLYLICSAIVHFLLCYVAIMYAFTSLQLGAIAGEQITKYTSEHVHFIVAVFSGCMVLLGLFYASFVAMSRWIVWQAALMGGWVSLALKSILGEFLSYTSDMVKSHAESMGPWPTLILTSMGHAYQFLSGFIISAVSSAHLLLFKSNMVGRSLLALFGLLTHPFLRCSELWALYVDKVFKVYEGSVETNSWRQDAYSTTRCLLAYSGTFVLLLLMLFNLSAKSATRNHSGQVDPDRKVSFDCSDQSSHVSVVSDSPPLQNSSSDASDSNEHPEPHTKTRRRTLTRSLSPHFDTIEEEGSNDGEENSKRNDDRKPQKSTLKKNKGVKFLRSRRRGTAAAGESSSVGEAQRFHRVVTM